MEKYAYEGFGYDRGHLAPSADFRWSKKRFRNLIFTPTCLHKWPLLTESKAGQI